MANLVASGLFGDGAAAVVPVATTRRSARGRSPDLIATRSRLYPDTVASMGWNIGDSGFGSLLAAELPELVAATSATTSTVSSATTG